MFFLFAGIPRVRFGFLMFRGHYGALLPIFVFFLIALQLGVFALELSQNLHSGWMPFWDHQWIYSIVDSGS